MFYGTLCTPGTACHQLHARRAQHSADTEDGLRHQLHAVCTWHSARLFRGPAQCCLYAPYTFVCRVHPRHIRLFFVLFVFLFVIKKPENPYFASHLGLAKPLGVHPLRPRSSSCGHPKGTPPPRDTLLADWGKHSKSWRVGSHPWSLDLRKPRSHPQPPNSVPKSPTSDPPKHQHTRQSHSA